ncbi:condensation domain-containing protein [Nonomuraea sp. NPDC050310]|uniref:condensation domain-containing protein n=1 Tax=Nonomuraea sp. NPDC050310 TaxID=3154935 RepID=UPI0033D8497F
MIVEFAGPGAGTAPLTWGQAAIWDAVQKTAPDDHYFNFGRIVRIPATEPGVVLDALGRLVERHGAFRTLVQDGGQRQHERGRLPVQAHDDPDTALAELTAARFDYAAEWPLRASLVVRDGLVRQVVLAFCHLAADGLGAEVAVRDLRLLALGRAPRTAAPQQLDLARWQAGPEGRHVAARAAEHWAQAHERMPTTMFPTQVAAPDTPPIWRALLHSPALELAVRALAARHATSTSTVLLSAVAKLAGTGISAVLPIVANRFRRETLGLVGTLSQEGLLTLDTDLPFAELLRRAVPAAMRAYRSAFHDPADRARVVAAESARRGEPVHPNCCFNDLRFADPGPAPCEPEELERALDKTTLSWPMSQDKLNCRFCVHVTPEGVSLTADTRYLPRPAIEAWLRGLESTLVEAALAEAPTGPGLSEAGRR